MTTGKITPKRRLTIHGQQLTDQDWRGALAILTTIGYFLVISTAAMRFSFTETVTAFGLLSTPEMLVLSWYFRGRENLQ